MIIYTLEDLKAKIWKSRQETSTNSVFTEAELVDIINEAQQEICDVQPWRFLETKQNYTCVSTTIGASSTGTALVGTSTQGLHRPRWIIVTDETNYESVQISSVDSATGITLVSPGLTNTYTSGYIILENNFFPHDIGKWVCIQKAVNGKNLHIVKSYRADSRIPVVKSVDDPTIVWPRGRNFDREPASGSYTADASTDSSKIIDAVLTALTTDYYKGWVLVNETLNKTSRITAYNKTTKTLTLETAITDQASGNTYHLETRLNEFELYPAPDSALVLRNRYCLIPPAMVNDYDVPYIPEKYQGVLINKALVICALRDRNNSRAKMDLKTCQWAYLEGLSDMQNDNTLTATMAYESILPADDEENDDI